MTIAVKPHPWMRYMIYRDLPEVLAIEAKSFLAPWSEEDFKAVLSCRNVLGAVVEADRSRDERLVGYMVYESHRDYFNLLNLAVATMHRRRGVGRMMLQRLCGKCSVRRPAVEVVSSEVNLTGHLFLRACGFTATEVLRGWFEEEGRPVADGYRFAWRLGEF